MRKLALTRLSYAIKGLLATAVVAVPMLGCGSSEPAKKSPEEMEKGRQEHAKRAQRELQDG